MIAHGHAVVLRVRAFVFAVVAVALSLVACAHGQLDEAFQDLGIQYWSGVDAVQNPCLAQLPPCSAPFECFNTGPGKHECFDVDTGRYCAEGHVVSWAPQQLCTPIPGLTSSSAYTSLTQVTRNQECQPSVLPSFSPDTAWTRTARSDPSTHPLAATGSMLAAGRSKSQSTLKRAVAGSSHCSTTTLRAPALPSGLSRPLVQMCIGPWKSGWPWALTILQMPLRLFMLVRRHGHRFRTRQSFGGMAEQRRT